MPTKLKNLVLHELSLVDFPANGLSKVTLFKRASAADRYTSIEKGDLADDVVEYLKRDFTQEQRDKDAESGVAMSDGSFPIANVKDLKNAIHALGRAKDPEKAKQHVVTRARALGAESELPAEWSGGKRAGDPGEHEGDANMADVNAEVVALKSQVDDLTKKIETLTNEKTELTKSVADLTKKNQGLTALKKAMPPALAAALEAKKDPKASADDMSEEDCKKCLADALKAHTDAEVEKVTKAAAEDEVIKIADPADASKSIELRKSVVGEQMFMFAKAQQAEIAKSREEAEIVTLTKQAETDLGNLPGTPVAKAKVLKAINGMPEETKKSFLDMLKAGNAALKAGFRPLGLEKGGDATDPESQLEKMAADYAKANNVAKSIAYDAILKTDDGKRLYRESLQASPAH